MNDLYIASQGLKGIVKPVKTKCKLKIKRNIQLSYDPGEVMVCQRRKYIEELHEKFTNHVAMHHNHGKGPMMSSSYLDVVVLKTQEQLFNPNVYDVTISAVMEDCVGFKAQKKWPRGSSA